MIHNVGHTSTTHNTNYDGQILDCLIDMFGRLGEQISNAVAAKIIENSTMSVNQESHINRGVNSESFTKQDVSRVIVHVTSDRDPVIFRGDRSDKFPVHEWIEMTKTLLLKQKCAVENQADEIMSRLMGRAGDIAWIS